MAIVKHKLFLVPIDENGNLNVNDQALKQLDKFLEDENIVYVNHSVTVLLKSQETSTHPNVKTNPQYIKFRTTNTFCVISLVYQDLKGTRSDISNLSAKSKKVVLEAVKSSQKFPKPNFLKS